MRIPFQEWAPDHLPEGFEGWNTQKATIQPWAPRLTLGCRISRGLAQSHIAQNFPTGFPY